ncbi:MAG TPA: dihydrofolate reductase family protein [Candidatus Saccharimonadales bacterium]|nr:dihydrofolate reductase family protein [Candidatus Saccharimonadales bacterium]
MRLVISEFVSADMVFEDPGGSEGTRYGGWSFDFNSPESMEYKGKELMNADALLLGRVTYQGFAAAWPKMRKTAGEFGEKMNSMPKYVVSSTLNKVDWENSQFIKGDLAGGIKKLKKQPGKDILVNGSGQLVRFLLDKNLVDKICLMVNPVVLGEGKLLFGSTEKHNLELSAVKELPKGVIVLEYEPKS